MPLVFDWLARLTALLHVGFVLFVVGGALLVRRRPRLLWPHLACAAWGAYVELAGAECPLTPLENWFARQAGRSAYGEGFIDHYLAAVLYPGWLTPGLQWAFGVLVVLLNAALYAWILRGRRLDERP